MPVCVGEVINTPKELIDRMQGGVYTFVQPDASVIGGISSVMEIFDAALDIDMDVVVHAWGGASAIMANYHVAFAGGGSLVEYPMLNFPLTTKMLNGHRSIVDGNLACSDEVGLGLTLTPEIETEFAFDPTAVYCCILNNSPRSLDSEWKI